MDYEKKYKDALAKAREIHRNEAEKRFDMEWLFSELKESEDERVKKRILLSLEKDLMATKNSGCDTQDLEQCIAWLEKQGKHQQLYIRFGDIPSNEKSKIYRGEKEIGTENGVSVYPAFKSTNGDIVLGLNLPITKTTLHTQQHLLEYDNRPCYLVTGDYVGKDTDGQILISNVNIIEKIDNYKVKTEKQGDTTSDTRYEVKAGNSFSANGTLFDYEHATITQKDFACDAEEASYTAEVATGDGSIKTVVSKKVSLPNPQSKKWSEEDEVINNELIKYFESLLDCLATEERHNENRKWLKWLKSIKNKI